MKIKLVYVGKRKNGNAVHHAFLNPDGEELLFRRAKWCVMGHAYVGTQTKDSTRISQPPEEMDCEPIEPKPSWIADNLEAENVLRRKRAAAKAKKRIEMTEVVSQLQRVCKDMSYFEKSAVINYLMDSVI